MGAERQKSRIWLTFKSEDNEWKAQKALLHRFMQLFPPEIDLISPPVPDSWRVLVTGITSIHGWPIFTQLQRLLPEHRLMGIRSPKMNIPDYENAHSLCITDKENLGHIKSEFRPTHVIHCAGVCDLDVCEERPAWASMLNVGGARVVVEVFGDIPVFFMSTDLVFSGENPPHNGYAEEHIPDPISMAGKTFREAEKVIQKCREWCIIRLGLPLGDSVTGDKGAVDWIESRFKRNLPVTLFHDEFRSCISCDEIGRMAVCALTKELRGIYHFGGAGAWSLHDIGRYVIEKGGYPDTLLTGIMRQEDIGGPPRIGDVTMKSSKIAGVLTG
ncbi:MAG: sugar nucleotide-binding protein [Chitinivibrionales bacterium]|nr:sugar nucleotide-binding protein [Chitinivibrionales bacterium]